MLAAPGRAVARPVEGEVARGQIPSAMRKLLLPSLSHVLFAFGQ